MQASIIDHVKAEICSGALKPGERLPPRAAYERRFETTPNTVQRAFTRLAEEGFIESFPRRGTFVVANPPHLSNYALLIYSKRVPGQWQNLFWETLDRLAGELTRTTHRTVTVRPCIAPEFHSQEYEELLAEVAAQKLAGLIFCFTPELAVDTPLLNTPGLPAVSLYHTDRPRIPTIGFHSRQFWQRAFEHLYASGRRRIAVVCAPGLHSWTEQSLPDLAAEFGLSIDASHVQSVDLLHPEWTDNLVQLLLRGPASERPDGLVVADDNLLDHACRGLIKSGLRLPDDLEVIGHTNFPSTGTDILPVRRLGYDIRQLLLTAMDEIDRLRRGEEVAERMMLPALFAGEQAGITRNPTNIDPHDLALASPLPYWQQGSTSDTEGI